MHILFKWETRERDPGLKFANLIAYFSEHITEYVAGNTENMNKAAPR